MKKEMIEFGFDGRGVRNVSRVVEVMFNSEEDLVRKCLLEEFESEEECVEYWNEFCGVESMEEVLEEVISIKREDEKNGDELGYMWSEDGYFRII